VDLIVYATGYRATIPCLAANGNGLGDLGRLRDGDATALFANVFSRVHPNLFAVGHFETDGGAYPVVSRQAALIAAVIRARRDAPAKAAWFDRLRVEARPDLSGGIRYIRSPRHSSYVQYETYGRYLEGLLRRLS
jgi:hypothetical protein